MCREIVPCIPYPLSVKIRLHENVETTINIMRRLLDVGVKSIAVHGRYYWQRGEKRGICNWEAIKTIKETFVDIPIIGNGDVSCYEDFEKFKSLYGVDSVMSGYGALLNPSIFSNEYIHLNQRINDYLTISSNYRNRWIDILRHLAWILKSTIKDKSLKSKLFCCQDFNTLREFLISLGVGDIVEGLTFN